MSKKLTKLMLMKMKTEMTGQKYPWKSAIEFLTSPEYAGANLTPNQRLLMKLWNLDLDLTDYESRTLEEWEEGFANEDYRSGCTSNVEQRIEYLKSIGQ